MNQMRTSLPTWTRENVVRMITRYICSLADHLDFLYMVMWEVTSHLYRGKVITISTVCAKLLQLCLTFCDTMGCSPPGSSVHGNSPGKILEWVALLSSKELTYLHYYV